MKELSLRARLWILVAALITIALLGSGVLIVQQQRIAFRGSEMVLNAHEEMSSSSELRDALNEIDRSAEIGEVPESQIQRFRNILRRIENDTTMPLVRVVSQEVRKRFDVFISSLSTAAKANRSYAVRARYDDLAAEVAALVARNENAVFRMSEQLGREQSRSLRMATLFLLVFVGVLAAAGFKIISTLTTPLSQLAAFLDQVHVERDFTSVLPSFSTGVPEISRVAKSFEELLTRLRGYRALNVSQLLKEKRRADIIAASISDGILLLQGEEVLYVNPTAERILGVTSKEIGSGIKLSDPKISEKSGARAVQAAVSSTIPIEYTLDLPDRKFNYLIQAYPISFDLIEQFQSGAPTDMAIDQFRANTLVLAQNVTLVRESQEAKSHFLATLSHEIKTPVTSLTMATRLLHRALSQIPNPQHQNLIMTCSEDVDRLRVLLDDLLTVTRFDTLTQRVELQKVDVNKLVKHSVQSFQFQAAERGVELIRQIDSDGEPLVIPMDPTKVAWALSNLITNAIRHTPKGGKVHVKARKKGEWVEVSVRDSGSGIDKSRQEKIFDKFNPYYDIRVARSGNTGAGLAIAREIVVAHGGKIWVSSEPGQGAEFYFALPIKADALERMDQKPGMRQILPTMKGAMNGKSARS